MAHPAGVIGSGVVLGAVAGGLFLFVNQMHRVNGVGLLRRQDWPVNDPWAWVVAGLVLGMTGALVAAARRAAHARRARDLAADLGLRYAEAAELPSGAEGMPLFAHWADGRDAMTGAADGVPVTLLDCTIITKGSDSDNYADRTVAVLPAPDLPAFDLRPRKGGHRLLGLIGLQGLTFDPAAAGPADADTVARFGRQFQLHLGDPLQELGALAGVEAPDRTDHEAAVRRLFTPALMGAVNEYPDYAAEAANGFLAVWHHAGRVAVPRRAELWDAAVALRAALIHRPAGEIPVVPARAGSDVGSQGRRMRNTVAGGAAGASVGFVVSGMVLSVLFFNREPGDGPGARFFLEAVVFLGLIVLGAAAGAGIGSRVPVRPKPPGPPEDPTRKKARERLIGCGGVAGTFAGFFGGFVAFVASKVVFNWDFDNFGVVGAIFFGSILGGSALGAVLGGVLMGRVARWRSK